MGVLLVGSLFADGEDLYDAVEDRDGEDFTEELADPESIRQIDFRDEDSGKTVLYLAVEAGQVDMAIKLLEKGASPATVVKGSTPLHLAVEKKFIRVAREMLRRGADASLVDSSKMTALQLAARQGLEELIPDLCRNQPELLADYGSPQHPKAVELALAAGQKSTADAILKNCTVDRSEASPAARFFESLWNGSIFRFGGKEGDPEFRTYSYRYSFYLKPGERVYEVREGSVHPFSWDYYDLIGHFSVAFGGGEISALFRDAVFRSEEIQLLAGTETNSFSKEWIHWDVQGLTALSERSGFSVAETIPTFGVTLQEAYDRSLKDYVRKYISAILLVLQDRNGFQKDAKDYRASWEKDQRFDANTFSLDRLQNKKEFRDRFLAGEENRIPGFHRFYSFMIRRYHDKTLGLLIRKGRESLEKLDPELYRQNRAELAGLEKAFL